MTKGHQYHHVSCLQYLIDTTDADLWRKFGAARTACTLLGLAVGVGVTSLLAFIVTGVL